MIVFDCWLCKEDSFNLGLLPRQKMAAYKVRYGSMALALILLPVVAVLINTGVMGKPLRLLGILDRSFGNLGLRVLLADETGELQLEVDDSVRIRKSAAAGLSSRTAAARS